VTKILDWIFTAFF